MVTRPRVAVCIKMVEDIFRPPYVPVYRGQRARKPSYLFLVAIESNLGSAACVSLTHMILALQLFQRCRFRGSQQLSDIQTFDSPGQQNSYSSNSFYLSQTSLEVIEDPKTNDRINGCTVLLPIEKINQINAKTKWKKRLCVRLRSGKKRVT